MNIGARHGQRVAFLFGSGVSRADDFPNTEELTRAVEESLAADLLRGDELVLFRALRWHIAREEDAPGGPQNPATRAVNYEDIYYLANQLCDLASGEYDNPAVYPLMDRLLADSVIGPIAYRDTVGAPSHARPLLAASRLGDISLSLTEEIKKTVTRELVAPLGREDLQYVGYRALVEALGDPAVGLIDVFTLNHDCLLEATLDRERIDYTVLVPGAGNQNYGRAGGRNSAQARVRIVKVHGSVDWGITRVPGEQPAERLRRLGYEGSPVGKSEPVILVGRFNKMADQANQVLFLDLLHAFRRRLARARHLVVSGYGFADKNVNTLLLEWLSWVDGRSAVIVHADRNSLLASARPAISGRREPDLSPAFAVGGLEEAERRGQLQIHPRWFEDTSWVDLKPLLGMM